MEAVRHCIWTHSVLQSTQTDTICLQLQVIRALFIIGNAAVQANDLPEYHIRELTEARKEVEIRLSMDAKGVRLDLIARDVEGRLINIEMQLRGTRAE